MIISRWAIAALAVVGSGAWVTAPALAQKTAPKKPVAAAPPVATKTVEQILDGYVTATGGKAAYAKVTSLESRGTLELPAQGIKGTTLTVGTAKNQFYSEQDIQGIGKSVTVYDGTSAWTKDPINGVRTLSGVELANIQREANFNGAVEWRKQYPTQKLLGVRKVNGKDAYAVQLTPKVGSPVVQYHDVNTLLLVRTDGVQEGPTGKNPFEAYVSDYRTVEGLKIPYSARVLIGAIELVTTVTNVKVNVTVDSTKFAKPTE